MILVEFFVTSYARLGKYLSLLAAVLLFLLLQPLFYVLEFSSHLAHFLLCLILLAAVVSSGNRRLARYLGLGLILPAFVFTWITDSGSPSWLISMSFALNVAILGVAVLSLLGDIYQNPKVDIHSIIGAITTYLLIGLAFALVYDWVALLDHDAIRGLNDFGTVEAHLSHSVYFSFVTLSTLGYGDITPVTPLARTIAWVEAVAGQLFLAVMIAFLVGKMVAEESRKILS